MFCLKCQEKAGKEVYFAFELIKTNGVYRTKIDYMIMQKRKLFYLLENVCTETSDKKNL